ncbi:MAG: sodium-coupled transporter [bacterium]|nr:MAG: sodium-coupled transporter [bacterium]
MLDLNIFLVLMVVIAAMVVFISGRLRVDLGALCVLGALLLLGLIEPGQALEGFASSATATVAAMFVLSAGLVRTGWVQWLVRRLGSLAGRSEARLLMVLCLAIAALSAFIINTATVAIFIPVAVALSNQRNISPSRVLMPLSFASQFGGVCTLIGTSTNILVSAIAVTYGLEPFAIFEFAPLGIVMSAVGILYLVLVTPRLIPARKGEPDQVDRYRLVDYLAEVQVGENSPLVGDLWDDGAAGNEKDVSLVEIIRGGKATSRASRTNVREGDILLLHGHLDEILRLQERYGLKLPGEERLSSRALQSHEVKLVEALVPPGSHFVGRTVKASNIRRRFGCMVLAVQRRGKVMREQIEDIELDSGDSLLLQGGSDDIERILKSDDLIVTNELTEMFLRKDKAAIAVGILLAVVGIAAFNVMPIMTAALLGGIGMVLTGCLTIEEAYQAIDWKVIFLLGGIIPLGIAIDQSGTASWLANTVLEPFVGFGPLVVLSVIYLTTALLTEAMSNNAAAVLLAPMAISLGMAMDVDPRPLLMAITFAASTSFATPIGYKTNTMIYAPGGYRFLDFTIVGGPLNFLFWGIAVLLIPVIWPF